MVQIQLRFLVLIFKTKRTLERAVKKEEVKRQTQVGEGREREGEEEREGRKERV